MTSTKTRGMVLAAALFLLGAASGAVLDRTVTHRSCRRPPAVGPGRHGSEGRSREDRILQRLTRDLSLSRDQASEVRAILQRQKREMDELMKDVSPRIEARMETVRKQIRSVLNDEQKARYDTLVDKLRRRAGRWKEGKGTRFRKHPR